MKTIEELNAIRDRMKPRIALRKETNETRIIVGMATCGIAAGARPVLAAFVEEIEKAGLTGAVMVTQSGCMGNCAYEPMVEVVRAGEEKVVYARMTPEKAREVVDKHIIGGKPIAEYTLDHTNL